MNIPDLFGVMVYSDRLWSSLVLSTTSGKLTRVVTADDSEVTDSSYLSNKIKK